MGYLDSKWAHPDGLLKTLGKQFLEHGRPDGKRGCPDGARATSLLSTFGTARSNEVPNVSSDELLGFLHLHHASGR